MPNSNKKPDRQFRKFQFNQPAKPSHILPDFIEQTGGEPNPGLFLLSRNPSSERLSPMDTQDASLHSPKALNFFSEDRRQKKITQIKNALDGADTLEHFINDIETPSDLTLMTGTVLLRELSSRMSDDQMRDLLFINFLAKTPSITHEGLEQLDEILAYFVDEYREMTQINDKPQQVKAIQNMGQPNKMVFQATMLALLEMGNETKRAPQETIVQFANDFIAITATRHMDKELTLATVRIFNELSITTGAKVRLGMEQDGTVSFTLPPQKPTPPRDSSSGPKG